MFTIYTITFHKPGHRFDGLVRYVGQTGQALSRRLAGHFAFARRGKRTALAAAVRKYGESAFEIAKVASCGTRQEADCLERAFIDTLKTRVSDRCGGLNLGGGGEGVDYSDPAVRAKHRAALDETWRAAQSARNINADPNFIAAQRSALAARWSKTSERHRQSEVMREVRRRPDVAAENALRNAARNRTPEMRAITAARNRSPEMRESSRKRAAAMNANPTSRLRMTISRNRQALTHYEATGQAEKAAATRERIAALTALLP